MINKKIIKEKKNFNIRPNFVEITKQILTQPIYFDIISWNVDGDKILLKNRQQFEQIVLPKYFKHNNYASYLRQLNIYGFTCQKQEQGILEIQNINFTQTKQDNILRKSISAYKELKNEMQQSHDDLKLQLFQMKDVQQKIYQQFKQNLLVNTQIRRIIYRITDNLRVLRQFREVTLVKFYKMLKTFIEGMVPDSQYLYCQLIVYVIKDDELMSSLVNLEMLKQYEFPLPNYQLQGQITAYLEKNENTLNPADFSFFVDNEDSYSNQFKL